MSDKTLNALEITTDVIDAVSTIIGFVATFHLTAKLTKNASVSDRLKLMEEDGELTKRILIATIPLFCISMIIKIYLRVIRSKK